MGESCDLVLAPPLWPPSPRSLIESSSTQTTWSAPQSCPPPETVSLARWSTRVEAAYSALSFICIVILFCHRCAGPEEWSVYSWGSRDLKYNLCPPSSYLQYYMIILFSIQHTKSISYHSGSTNLHYDPNIPCSYTITLSVTSFVLCSPFHWYNGSYVQRGLTILPFMRSSV